MASDKELKSEIYWFDKDGNIVETQEKAVSGVIRETDEDGNTIMETWLVPERK